MGRGPTGEDGIAGGPNPFPPSSSSTPAFCISKKKSEEGPADGSPAKKARGDKGTGAEAIGELGASCWLLETTGAVARFGGDGRS